MSKTDMAPATHLHTVTLWLMAFILLALPLLSACQNKPDNGRQSASQSPEKSFSFNDSPDNDAGDDDKELLPVIFIPGVQGSQLVSAKDSRKLWPPGGPGKNIEYTNLRDDFRRLSLNPQEKHEKIYSPDVIRTYGSDPIYDPFLSFLKDKESGGYIEWVVRQRPEPLTTYSRITPQKLKPSLFVFAYDWRLGIEDNERFLAEYVDVVSEFYPGKKVNIVTHSMGGLLARRYIIDHPDRVNKLITIAAPFLGSAKPLYQMANSKLDAPAYYLSAAAAQDWALELVATTPITEMLNYFPGVHELMSSESYFTLGGPPYTVATFAELFGEVRPALKRELSFAELMGGDKAPKDSISKVDEMFPNPAIVDGKMKSPAKTNRDFHGYSAGGNKQDDWSSDSTHVKYYHLIGVQDSNDTVLALQEAKEIPGKGRPVFQGRDIAMNLYGAGDGTVPLISAARIGKGQNLNAPDARLFIYTGGKLDLTDQAGIIRHSAVTLYTGSEDKLLDHTGIMKNTSVMAKVLELLREEDEPIVTTPPPAATQPAAPRPTPGGRWILSETKLPTYDTKPQIVNNSLGTHEMTRSVSESEISWKVRTLDKKGSEVGTSSIILKIDKPPAELSGGQKVNWQVTWQIIATGVPSYTSSFVELRQGEFSGKLTPINLKENPSGSVTFEWTVPGSASNTLDQFELSAKLSIPGGRDTVVWVYRPRRD